MGTNYGNRPLISLDMLGNIVHNGTKCEVVFYQDKMAVGCTDITINAAKQLLEAWEREFGKQPIRVVYQRAATVSSQP